MTAALHRDLAAVYERHGVHPMARDHRCIAEALERVTAAGAAAEAAIGSIPVTGVEVDSTGRRCFVNGQGVWQHYCTGVPTTDVEVEHPPRLPSTATRPDTPLTPAQQIRNRERPQRAPDPDGLLAIKQLNEET